MRKIINVGILFIILVPCLVSATSGACSYHGGVNCSAGVSLDGHVQCNDGSISSVMYDDMVMCKDTEHLCNAQESALIDSQMSIGTLRQQLSNLNSLYQQKSAEYNSTTGSQNIPSLFISGQMAIEKAKRNAELQSISESIITAQQNLNYANGIARKICATLGQTRYDEMERKLLLMKIENDMKPAITVPTVPTPQQIIEEETPEPEVRKVAKNPVVTPIKKEVISPVVPIEITPTKEPVKKNFWKRIFKKLKFW